jgi:hypothetical protein
VKAKTRSDSRGNTRALRAPTLAGKAGVLAR